MDLEDGHLGLPAELDHLDRHRSASAKHGDELALIHNYDLAAAGLSDDLLVEHRAAAALDHVQRR